MPVPLTIFASCCLPVQPLSILVLILCIIQAVAPTLLGALLNCFRIVGFLGAEVTLISASYCMFPPPVSIELTIAVVPILGLP